MTRIMVAGIGSPHGQDIAGWLVIDKLEKNFSPRLSSLVECVKLQTPMDLIDRIELSPAANCNMQQTWILVDACLGLDAGAVHRWTWPEIPNELATRSSTHALGLIETIRVAESLGILAKQVRIYGVSTEDLQASVDRCAELIRSDLSELLA
ncbi:MAG: hydrogenase maturation protease [Planctomycetota bacterium]|jgi:hydrogenase maturation protease